MKKVIQASREIIDQAITQYKPVQIALMFSGGHDSLTSTHMAATYLKELGRDFIVYHGNTGIGIPETREFVYQTVKKYGWKFYEGHAKENTYKDQVTKYGFPGPTKTAHQIMYRLLKERPIRKFVTHHCKSTTHARENVLLITGIRQSESRIRMGYKDLISKDNSRVWVNPNFSWSEEDVEKYINENELDRNPVKETICISGECLCGAFAGKEELAEIKEHYPNTYEEIEQLHQLAIANGHQWGWASGPTEWRKDQKKSKQMKMFICVGCEDKRFNAEEVEQKRKYHLSTVDLIHDLFKPINLPFKG